MHIGSRTRRVTLVLFALSALLALLLGVSSATADPTIQSKQQQAQAIIVEIQQMDSQLSKAIEAYNYANVELGRIDGDLVANTHHLSLARHSLTVAQRHIARRLKGLYVNGDGGGAIEVILGAESLDDLLNRIDVAQRVGQQDAKVLKAVKHFRKEVQERRQRLKKARTDQARIVSERAATKQSIEGQLGERERLLASVKDEIARLQEQERRRQAYLAAQARARLVEQQRAAELAERQREILASVPADQTIPSPDTYEPSYAAPPAEYGGVVGVAMSQLGTPYVWGGMSPGGFDCSGLIAWAYSQVGVSLPHHAASQYNYGAPVSRDELQPGDLVFFDGLGHAGIYVGGDSFIHAPHTGDVVKISSLNDSWYASTWVGARRITG
jgi:cell wall-associated NlpC family hydrolase